MSDSLHRKPAEKKVDANLPPLIPSSRANVPAGPAPLRPNDVVVVRSHEPSTDKPPHQHAFVIPPPTDEERKSAELLQRRLEHEAAAAAEATAAASDGKLHGLDVSGDGGVIKKVLKPGHGPCPKPQQNTVAVSYSGRLASTGEEFDSDNGYPFVFPVGVGKVIKGWEVAIPTMALGETCRLVIRSDYAYGDKGSAPGVPPHATLVFTVTLQDIRRSQEDVSQKQVDFKNDQERLLQIKKEREEAAARRAALQAEKDKDKQKKAQKLEELQAKLEAKKKGKVKPKGKGKGKDKDDEAPGSESPEAPAKKTKKTKAKEASSPTASPRSEHENEVPPLPATDAPAADGAKVKKAKNKKKAQAPKAPADTPVEPAQDEATAVAAVAV